MPIPDPTDSANSLSTHEIEDLYRWDREIVWHAFSQMSDYDGIVVEHAQGAWITDIQGRKYLDASGSLWCNTHGHRHAAIDAAIRRQLDQVAHVTLLGMNHPTTIRLAKELVDLSPKNLKHVFFSSDGSSAIEVALKMAFQFWQQTSPAQPARTKYLAVGNSYHGDTLGSVSVGGVARFHAMFDPLLFKVIRGPCPDTYRLPPNVGPEGACEHYLSAYRELIERHSHELAAIIIEPLVQCAAGIVRHPAGFLKGLSRLAKQHDVLLIADEIAVGMGRTGRMFACEHESVEPDFLCLGKGLSGGYLPLAATLTSARVWQAFLGTYAESKSFFHGHTFSGNPLAAAAASATLQLFEQEKTLQNVQTRSEQLQHRLESLLEHPNVGSLRICGLIVGIELVEDKLTKSGFPWSQRIGHQVCLKALVNGIWMRPIGNVLIAMPPLNINESEVDLLCDAIHSAIKSLALA